MQIYVSEKQKFDYNPPIPLSSVAHVQIESPPEPPDGLLAIAGRR